MGKSKPTGTHILQAIDPRYFHLVVLPTEQCSFRCVYCYEDFSQGRISPEIISGIKRLIERRAPSLEELELSWFGGEPLLAKDIIFDIHKYIHSLEKKLKFSANITTNGYHLDSATARQLLKLGVATFQISLDGAEPEHNRTRVGKGGFPTFQRIIDNLSELKKINKNYEIILRVHCHPENILGIPDLLNTLDARLGSDKRFKIYFKNINQLGGKNDTRFQVFGHAEWKRIKQSLEVNMKNSLTIYQDKTENYICYAARLNSFVIRSNGEVAKCTVALGNPSNIVGRLNSDGTLSLNNEKLRFWARGLEGNDLSALQCPLHQSI